MSRVGVDRLAPGLATTGSGGSSGGGNSSSDTITQTLNAGTNDVTHTLGAAPTTWIIQDSSGRVLTFEAAPKSGSETTILEVTALIEITNARITVFTEA
jgi:hypothetical protein